MSLKLPDENHSYWLDSAAPAAYPALRGDIYCDTVIIGGGIAGLTTAYLLQKAGKKVVVLEKNSIASGTTGGTTGKVTTQHGLIYHKLMSRFGEDLTRKYAMLSQKAFDDMRNIIKKEQIECEWTELDNYIYSGRRSSVSEFKQEAKVAARLGLPASFVTNTELPFRVRAAVRFNSQAYINAAKYTRGLAEIVTRGGGTIFEKTEARLVNEDANCKVSTKHGLVIAKNIIVATKIPPGPLVARVSYARIEYPETSYLIAGHYSRVLNGMYISPDKTHHSLLPIKTASEPVLFVGGGKHIPGLGRETKHYKQLTNYGERWFGLSDVMFRWKAMDYIAYDYLPVVGRLYPSSKRTFVISGFKKWGMNLSMVAASLIRDAIVTGELDEIFSPQRTSALRAIPSAILNYLK